MKKLLKILAIVLGVLVLLVGAALVYLALTFDSARIKQEIVRVVQEKKQRTLTINGEVKLHFWPSVGVDLGQVSLSEYQSAQGFARFDSASVAVQLLPLLRQQIVADKIALSGLQATLIKRKDGTLNIADLLKSDPQTPAASGLPVFAVAGLALINAKLHWLDESTGSKADLTDLDIQTGALNSNGQRIAIDKLTLGSQGQFGSDAFTLKLATPALSFTQQDASVAAGVLTLDVSLNGPTRKLAAALALSAFSGSAKAIASDKLTATLDGQFGATSVKGNLASPVQADLAGQVFTLPALTGQLTIANPAMPMQSVNLPIKADVVANLAAQQVTTHLITQLDDSHITLTASTRRLSPLALNVDVAIDQLNVDHYLPPTKAASNVAKNAASPDAAFDLSGLKALNLTGTLRIGKLQARSIKASNVRIDLNAVGGKVAISPLAANLYQGSTTGALLLNAASNGVSIEQSFTGVAINPLMQDALNKDLIEGRGNIKLALSGQGNSLTALKKSLNGSARLSLQDGALKGINLAQSFRQAKAKLSMNQDAVQSAKASDKTDFSELTASFTVSNGVAHNDDLAAKSPFLRLTGSGAIDIANNRMDYLAKAAVVGTSGGQGGKELDSVKGLTVPVKISGPFDQLSYQLAYSSMLSDATKAQLQGKADAVKEAAQQKVDAKKDEVKTQVQDKLKDSLKGLFNQ